MKYSQFNSIVQMDENFAMYNSFTQKVIFIEEVLKDLVEAAKLEGIDNLIDYHPTFYDYLIKEEFLIPDNVNEVDKVREVSRLVDNDETVYHLTINPTMNCNFKCLKRLLTLFG